MKLNGYAGWGTGVLIVVEGKKYLSLIKQIYFVLKRCLMSLLVIDFYFYSH